jgi:arylsulfatase A-like enzyme
MYAAMVSSMDDQVGRILDDLETRRLLDNTMIWFISDNGGYSESYFGHADNGPLRGEKATLWEGGIRIPAMVCWTGHISPRQVMDQPMCNTDILPTIAGLVGMDEQIVDLPVDGLDMREALFSGASVDRTIFWKYRNQSALRQGSWKMRNGSQLYNLEDDIGEQYDVAASHPEVLSRLNALYKVLDNGVGSYSCD